MNGASSSRCSRTSHAAFPASTTGAFSTASWVLRSGAPWRDLPNSYGPHTTCYNRFVRWRRAGVWDRIMDALAAAHDAAVQMIDTSVVRVHQRGSCIADNKEQHMGRSRAALPARSTPSWTPMVYLFASTSRPVSGAQPLHLLRAASATHRRQKRRPARHEVECKLGDDWRAWPMLVLIPHLNLLFGCERKGSFGKRRVGPRRPGLSRHAAAGVNSKQDPRANATP
jgi:transposase